MNSPVPMARALYYPNGNFGEVAEDEFPIDRWRVVRYSIKDYDQALQVEGVHQDNALALYQDPRYSGGMIHDNYIDGSTG